MPLANRKQPFAAEAILHDVIAAAPTQKKRGRAKVLRRVHILNFSLEEPKKSVYFREFPEQEKKSRRSKEWNADCSLKV